MTYGLKRLQKMASELGIPWRYVEDFDDNGNELHGLLITFQELENIHACTDWA